MHSGDILKKASITRDTLRHYIKLGLIRPIDEERNGYKIYADKTAEDVIFIRHAQEIGFTLHEIKQLLDQIHTAECPHQSLIPHLQSQLENIDEKIRTLRKAKKHIQSLIQDFEKKDCHIKPSKLEL